MSLSIHTLLKHHIPSMYVCKQKQVYLQHTGLHTRSYKQLLNKDGFLHCHTLEGAYCMHSGGSLNITSYIPLSNYTHKEFLLVFSNIVGKTVNESKEYILQNVPS